MICITRTEMSAVGASGNENNIIAVYHNDAGILFKNENPKYHHQTWREALFDYIILINDSVCQVKVR